MPFRHRPPVIDEFDFSESRVYTLRGPRQVGKTTACKLLIQRLLESGTPARRILYYSLDLETDPESILQVVRTAKRSHPQPQGRWHIFLDEISSVPRWQKAIKYLRDQTDAAEDVFILTGSIATDIRRGAELLPGRRGRGPRLDKLLLPLSFREFVAAVRGLEPEGGLALPRFIEPDGPAEDLLHGAMLHAGELDDLLSQYAAIGGFPAAVADSLNTGEISDDTVRTLWSFVSTDLVGLGRDPQVMARLLERVGLSLGTPLSWNRLAGELGVSAPTAQDYVRHLTESFAIISLYAWDTSRETVALRKGKKLYALDPLFLRVPGLMGPSRRQPALPQMVEDLIGMGLYRTGEVPHLEGIYMPRTLFYWVSTKGREVDFLVWRSGAQTPVEVRYQQRVRPVDGQVMYQAFRRGLLASRLSFSLEGSIPIVPAGVFLWLLEDGLRSPVSDAGAVEEDRGDRGGLPVTIH